MIAFWLRCMLGALLLALLAQYGAANPALAALNVLAAFLALHSGIVVASFATSRYHAFEAPPELAPRFPAAIPVFLHEWLAYLALFVLIQPFERLWMGNDALAPSAPGRAPALLVHGYMCNRGAWWWLRGRLRAAGFIVATVNLEPPLGGIDAFADQLHSRIEALCAGTGAGQVVLVGHSMGGLAARAYLYRHGPTRVAKLVTLGSPHHGTRLARFGPGRNAREMQPGSAWLRALEAPAPPVPALSIWSAADNFISPQDSSRLAGARERMVPALGHLAMLFSPVILAMLIDELAQPNGPHR
jgi:triacylglycerol lipase